MQGATVFYFLDFWSLLNWDIEGENKRKVYDTTAA